jgi:hypothetical protein
MIVLEVIGVIALIALTLWSLYKIGQARAEQRSAPAGRYRVIETTSGSEAHVFIGRGTRDSAVLIGSVALDSDDFDDRYATLVLKAEDRAATLNASRELHGDS